MATQTYKWFTPDPTLRAAYGGASIQDGGDSQEIDAATLTIRHICRELDLIENGASQIGEIGNDGTDDWIRVSDNLYSAISPHLSTAELATVTSTEPSGYSGSSRKAELQPSAHRTSFIVRGDSISDGLGTTSGDTEDVVWGQLIADIDSAASIDFQEATNVALGHDYSMVNMSIGSSSWANTDAVGGQAVYPYREDLAYNQRTKTHALKKGIFIYWLGTNDLAYDTDLSGADCWSRASSRIGTFTTDFPDLKLIVCTAAKRSESSALNDRIDAYNDLMRANYSTAGAHILCDFEADVDQVNIVNGDTTDTTYYTDGVHMTTAMHTLLMPVARTAFRAAEALL